MPKKRKRGDDESTEEDDDEYRESDEDPPPKKMPPKKTPSKKKWDPDEVVSLRQKKRRLSRKNDDDMSDEDMNDEDTHARMTDNGGYAHTLTSKLRISKANKGREPWNKGGQRSAADKAKISEGVRARNRAVLLDKLEKLGLTEEEWIAKKKQIKYLRERVRVAKKANDRHRKDDEKMLNDALAETTVENGGSNAKKAGKKKVRSKPVDTENKYAKKVLMAKVKLGKPLAKAKPDSEPKSGSKRRKEQKAVPSVVPPSASAAVAGVKLPSIFARDVNWTYHPFDSSESDSPYDSTCPKGGPGGLICCDACTKNYSVFLTATSKDMEEQKTQKVNNEVKELLGFLSSARSKLNSAIRLAKQQSGAAPFPRPDTERQKNPEQKQKATPKQRQQNHPPPPEQQPVEQQLPDLVLQNTLPSTNAFEAQMGPVQSSEWESEGLDGPIETVAV